MLIKKSFFLYLIVLTYWTLVNPAKGQTFSTESGYAEFQANASLNDYKGVSNKLHGSIDLNDKKVHFSLPFESIDTGIKKRNKHMKELVETDKYPTIEFDGKIVSEINPDHLEKQPVTVKGNFTMHGVTKEITVEGTVERKENKLLAEASWEVLITDYKIEPPKLLGNKVQDKHKIVIKADMPKKD